MKLDKNLENSLEDIKNLIFINKNQPKEFLDMLNNFMYFFKGKEREREYDLSFKLYGYPSFIFSYTKKEGFYIATRSALEPKPIYNKSIEDIHRNYPETQEKLKGILEILFLYLSTLNFEGTFKADFLYSKHSVLITKNLRNSYGNLFVVFNPDSLTYAIPYESELATDVLESNIGIFVYAMYSSPTIEDAKIITNKNSEFYKKFIHNRSRKIKIFYPHVVDISSLKYVNEEFWKIRKVIDDLNFSVSSIDSSIYDTILSNPAYENLVKTFILTYSKNNISVQVLKSFIDTIVEQEEKEIFSDEEREELENKYSKLYKALSMYIKSLQAMKEWTQKIEFILKVISYNIKRLEELQRYISYSVERNTDIGRDEIVCLDIDKNIIKLVNKEEFAHMDINSLVTMFRTHE